MRFGALQGVLATRVGYTGGTAPSPTYKSVCGGDGHTEGIRVTFDPAVVSYEQLLNVFFEEHNPTGRRGKVQYKSAIWYHSPEQEAAARAAVVRHRAATARPARGSAQRAAGLLRLRVVRRAGVDVLTRGGAAVAAR